jgi:hypothetical protein
VNTLKHRDRPCEPPPARAVKRPENAVTRPENVLSIVRFFGHQKFYVEMETLSNMVDDWYIPEPVSQYTEELAQRAMELDLREQELRRREAMMAMQKESFAATIKVKREVNQ